jgi:hypothetical protein
MKTKILQKTFLGLTARFAAPPTAILPVTVKQANSYPLIMFTSSKNTRRKFGLLFRLAAFMLTAALLICSIPSTSHAAPVNTPLTISFFYLKCNEDTDEWNDDEPYVVFFVANLKSGVLATTDAKRSTLFGGVDAGDVRLEQTVDFSKNPPISLHPVMLWGTKGKPAPIANPNDIIILAAVIENDSSSPDSVVSAVDTSLAAKLQVYRANGFSRAKIVEKLITDMNGAIDAAFLTGVPDKDERIGTAKEIQLTSENLENARNGSTVFKYRQFYGDDASYKVRIDIKKG